LPGSWLYAFELTIKRSLLLSIDDRLGKVIRQMHYYGRDLESYIAVPNDERMRVWNIKPKSMRWRG
jgi:hypothetical protein